MRERVGEARIRCVPCVPANLALNFPSAERTTVEFEAAHAARRLRGIGHAFFLQAQRQVEVEDRERALLPSVWFRPILSCRMIRLKQHISGQV